MEISKAIEILKRHRPVGAINVGGKSDSDIEAFNLAIEILEKQLEKNKKLEKEINLNIKKTMNVEGLADVNKIKIWDVGFSAKTYSYLSRVKIQTLGDIAELTEKELFEIRNLGRKSIEEIKNVLENYGLKLREEK